MCQKRYLISSKATDTMSYLKFGSPTPYTVSW